MVLSVYKGLCFFTAPFFVKPFKTLDEQIQILRDRGMIIHDEESAKDYLLSNTYYNIINGYSKYFPRNVKQYTAGTSFNEVCQLYLFDKELKQAFFEALISAETHIKSIFAHRFAEAHPDEP
jgi:abortive infection bacteriophage resistance protein